MKLTFQKRISPKKLLASGGKGLPPSKGLSKSRVFTSGGRQSFAAASSSQRNRKPSGKIRPAVLWFTGLSGSGKSAIAKVVVRRLKKLGVDLEHLDGDAMRSIFPNTGFTKSAREEHIRRVGFLAAMLEKHGVTVVASFVSPYRESRAFIRKLCRNFIEVYVSTPLEVCEQRDVKGLYRQARRGEIRNFTGISDPYEQPKHPEITIDTRGMTVSKSASLVMNYIRSVRP
jgi:adenylylsulfate kinase